MKFSIIFDNQKYNANLDNLWGFSCLIEIDNQKILFDTGSNGRILLKNASKMEINLKEIDTVFISHSHWDHIGGLDTIIEENPNITLIIPNTLSKHLIKDLKNLVKHVIVIDSFTKISSNLYSTGIMGDDMKEHSLIIEKNNRLYIVSGCSHSGINNIEKRSIDILNKRVEYIIGGFHMMYKSPVEIQKIIKNLHTKYLTATHCTGDIGVGMLKLRYKNRFINGGAGAIIKID